MNSEFFFKIKKYKYLNMIKAALLSLVITFIIFCAAALVIPVKGEKAVNVFDDTIRLRVIANSNSEQDQNLKLAVRNDIIDTAHEIFRDCTDIQSAKKTVQENMTLLTLLANESLKRHGSDYEAVVTFGTEKCPVRRYSEFTFPAGEYMTLRINIGEAKGENWWCVMYPPLCVTVATNEVEADVLTFKNHGFNDEQIQSLRDSSQSKPEIRFAALDFLKKIFI